MCALSISTFCIKLSISAVHIQLCCTLCSTYTVYKYIVLNYYYFDFRTLPLLVWHRQNWNIVYPNVDLNDLELDDLATHSTYIAGFTDTAVEGRSDLYDLFINGRLYFMKLNAIHLLYICCVIKSSFCFCLNLK